MTRYACSSVTAFVPAGGVCAGHSINDEPADDEFPGLSVDCPVCDPILAADPFWASSPESVPLTEVEERRLERQKRELEVDAFAQKQIDAEYLRRKRSEDEADARAAAPKPRVKARGASA